MTPIHRAGWALACAAILAAAPAAAQQTPAAEVYELRGVEVAPRPLNAGQMAAVLNTLYPESLRASGVSGTVRVSMIVGPDGVPREARVVESADSAFNAPTLAAVRTLRFSPAELNDQPVHVRVELPIVWQTPAALAAVDSAARGERFYAESELRTRPRPRNVQEVQRAIERAYPPRLRDAGIEPSISVRLYIGADGVPVRTAVLQSTHAEVNDTVPALMMNLRFRPGMVDGKAVPCYVDLPIHFQVGSGLRRTPYE
jgi:TonB family protein